MGFQHYSLPFGEFVCCTKMLVFIFLLLFKKILLEIKSHLFSPLSKWKSLTVLPFLLSLPGSSKPKKKKKKTNTFF